MSCAKRRIDEAIASRRTTLSRPGLVPLHSLPPTPSPSDPYRMSAISRAPTPYFFSSPDISLRPIFLLS